MHACPIQLRGKCPEDDTRGIRCRAGHTQKEGFARSAAEPVKVLPTISSNQPYLLQVAIRACDKEVGFRIQAGLEL